MANQKKRTNNQDLKTDKNTVLFVDGNYLAFKSYFPVENLPLATKRFLRATYRLKQKTGASMVTVSFDHDRRENFRYDYTWYKKSRKKAKHRHDEVYKELLRTLPEQLEKRGVKVNSSPKFEADDLIGISSKFFSDKNKKVIIYTGDKDLLQLVDKNIEIWRPLKGTTKKLEIHNFENFKELNDGFEPYQLKELKGLIGDRSDNIPGIIDLNNEIAKDLIREFKTIDGIYKNLSKIDPEISKLLKRKEKIARISLEVGTITTSKK